MEEKTNKMSKKVKQTTKTNKRREERKKEQEDDEEKVVKIRIAYTKTIHIYDEILASR